MSEFAHGFHIFRDGSAWCTVGPHFRNLQKDKAGFGDTPHLAYEAWKAANKNLAFWLPHAMPEFDKFSVHDDRTALSRATDGEG